MMASPRSRIPIDILPESILEEIADTADQMPAVLAALNHLPDNLALVIVGRHIAKLNYLSLAANLHKSQLQVYRMEQIGLGMLRTMLRR